MNFKNSFRSLVSDGENLKEFSKLLTQAVSNVASIRPIQTQDTLEPWGTATTTHDYCYGRHLYYKTQWKYFLPFWIGLNDDKNGNIFVAVTFDKFLVTKLGIKSNIENLQTPRKYSEPPTSGQDWLEIRMKSGTSNDLFKNHDATIFSNFLNEVLGVL